MADKTRLVQNSEESTLSLEREREEWEKEALAESLPSSVIVRKEKIADVECVWVSEESNPDSRVLVYLHGGGLVAGSAVTHQSFAAKICESSKCNVLLVNYRLLPENEYPAPLEDVLALYNALIGNYGYSSDQIILGGDSSGGGASFGRFSLFKRFRCEDAQKGIHVKWCF